MLKVKNIVNPLMKKYGLPMWVAPFAYSYVKSDPLNAAKRAISFIDVKRKKGEVTKKGVFLPNGYKFDTGSIGTVLNIFLYTENRVSDVVDHWLSRTAGHDYAWYKNYFSALSANDKRHAKAIKNLMDGLGIKPAPVKRELDEPFEYLQEIESWPERLIALEVVLKRSYSTFGMVFYKVFYPASPEFMRSFIKVFRAEDEASWESNEIERILNEGLIKREQSIETAKELLKRFYKAVDSYSSIARKEKIDKEVKLVTEVAIASPLQFFHAHGFEIDIEDEVRKIEKSAMGK